MVALRWSFCGWLLDQEKRPKHLLDSRTIPEQWSKTHSKSHKITQGPGFHTSTPAWYLLHIHRSPNSQHDSWSEELKIGSEKRGLSSSVAWLVPQVWSMVCIWSVPGLKIGVSCNASGAQWCVFLLFFQKPRGSGGWSLAAGGWATQGAAQLGERSAVRRGSGFR